MAAQKNKQAPPVRITHAFPPPRTGDGERFVALIRMLMKMGQKVEKK